MRTTLTIDDDVWLAARERASREHRSTGAVISELARQALIGKVATVSGVSGDAFHGFRPLPRRGSPVSNALIDKLREDEHE